MTVRVESPPHCIGERLAPSYDCVRAAVSAGARGLFEAEILEASPEEHDAHMALIQVLVHEKTMVLGSVLQRLEADLPRSLHFASPIERLYLARV
jgi:prephenate dehydrogenase